MTTLETVSGLSNSELLTEVKAAVERERQATARLVALLTQVDSRRLYLGEGCSSLFTYCTQVLRLSEHAAYGRIEAARAARQYPLVLDKLADGSLTLTAITLLAPHLTPANHHEVLAEAHRKSKREIEHIVARLRPQPAVVATVRKLPAPVAPPVAARSMNARSICEPPALAPPTRPGGVTPLAPERYKVQFSVSRETHDTLRRVQNLLRHAVPNGDLAVIFDRAIAVLLSDLEKARQGATANPRPARAPANGSRHIPATVRREVWKRDEGRCAFVGTQGRCTERGFLEFHHVKPYADGGATVVENLELRCRAHNVYEAEEYFGSRLPLLRERGDVAYACNPVRTELAFGHGDSRSAPLESGEALFRFMSPMMSLRAHCTPIVMEDYRRLGLRNRHQESLPVLGDRVRSAAEKLSRQIEKAPRGRCVPGDRVDSRGHHSPVEGQKEDLLPIPTPARIRSPRSNP